LELFVLAKTKNKQTNKQTKKQKQKINKQITKPKQYKTKQMMKVPVSSGDMFE